MVFVFYQNEAKIIIRKRKGVFSYNSESSTLKKSGCILKNRCPLFCFFEKSAIKNKKTTIKAMYFTAMVFVFYQKRFSVL